MKRCGPKPMTGRPRAVDCQAGKSSPRLRAQVVALGPALAEAQSDAKGVDRMNGMTRTGSQLRPGAPSAQLTIVFCARVGRAKPRGLLESARRHDMESSAPVAHLVRPFEMLM